MTEEEKQEAIAEVLSQVQTSRANLGLEDGQGSNKATSLADDLSEAWKSPKAEDYETEIIEIVNSMYSDWDGIEGALSAT
ncbi:hypothetical protein [Actinomyces sp. MRS3W]|uniref:hypothetical protein n=1 Tax=Actinomyces sp. MRS3W TaxID=2800796 RepID=UPI0028FDB178|nr:hypothetical protein [Actinomyces sp. MRS3W]MDU0348685.1 hypothetical protein [Actinomyces sp. MRS3W]